MCGIYGHAAPPHTLAAHEIKRAVEMSAYRGPDASGAFGMIAATKVGRPYQLGDPASAACDVLIAHNRLSILDLSNAANQPMCDATKRYWITYNGEVYNYLELRSELEAAGHSFRSTGDTEVVLAAYAHWGPRCVERFNGMWAFSILDTINGVLFCSRDRFGIKPFHYRHDRSRSLFVFASEPKQLVHLVPAKRNDDAIYEFLIYGSFDHAEETFFDGILKLQPGHNLTFHLASGELALDRYYNPDLKIHEPLSATAAADEFRHLLVDAVNLQLRSDVPVGSCLSGGLDSSALVCAANQILGDQGATAKQHTFSSHFDSVEANELEYMRSVIDHCDVQDHFVEPTADEMLSDLQSLVYLQDEPFGSTSIYAQWRVFKLVNSTSVKVMLDGQGADEQLAGYLGFVYEYFAQLKQGKNYSRLAWERGLFEWMQRSSTTGLARKVVGRLLGTDVPLVNPGSDWINPDFAKVDTRHPEFPKYLASGPFDENERLNNLCYAMTMHNNVPSLLRYEDRNSMAWSVEARVPFLDHRLVEYVLALPARYKVRNGYTKWVLRRGFRGIIPKKIEKRVSKLGFATPESSWQRGILRERICDAIHDPRLASYIQPAKAQAYFDHLCTNQIKDFLPWRWLNLVMWLDAYESV